MNHSIFHVAARIGALTLATLLAGSSIAVADEPKPAAPPAATQEPVSPDQIKSLVQQLGDKDYYVRQHAQDELARLGFEAFDALNAAAADSDLEVASRAKYLLRLMRVEWTTESDSPAVKKCLRDYEFEDPRSRELRMHALASLPGGQGAAALCRLTRFERATLLSKAAALALLNSTTVGDPPNSDVIETVRKSLKDCQRPGAVWLLTWARLSAEPDAVMAEWSKLVDDEDKLRKQSPNDTAPEIVGGLIRFQVIRLKQLGKSEEALAAIGRLVELDRGNPETLAELMDWLVEQKAWKAVDDLAQRFAPLFASEPILMYSLADAFFEQGRKDQAEKAAGHAFRLHPGKQIEQLVHHVFAARSLRRMGRFPWAQREFEYVIAQDAADNEELQATTMAELAEMLHDQGDDSKAAETLEKLVEAIDAGKVSDVDLGERKPEEFRARMHFFFACHWEAKGDAAKRREALDKALKADPADVDVLIACYRLPDPTPEYRQQIGELIRKSAAACREQIAQDPDNPSPYNQFAWLIGNTEGDFDEALRYSQKSLELIPDEGGFYDTMARVYFAKGDLDNAVQQQTKAAKLEPHSGQIQRQLDFFRQKRQEKKTQ